MQVERIKIIFRISGRKKCTWVAVLLFSVFLLFIRLRWLKNIISNNYIGR